MRNAVTTKRLYDEVTGQFRKLQELEVARETLTHMMVHDLRSPLTGLQAYLDLLGMAIATGAKDEVLEFAREANVIAGQLKELVSQVLDVSRLESGQMPLATEETDLVPLVPVAVASLGPAPADVRVAYDMPGHAVVVTCDRDLVCRVLTNLVGNAYKFTPKGAWCALAWSSEMGVFASPSRTMGLESRQNFGMSYSRNLGNLLWAGPHRSGPRALVSPSVSSRSKRTGEKSAWKPRAPGEPDSGSSCQRFRPAWRRHDVKATR